MENWGKDFAQLRSHYCLGADKETRQSVIRTWDYSSGPIFKSKDWRYGVLGERIKTLVGEDNLEEVYKILCKLRLTDINKKDRSVWDYLDIYEDDTSDVEVMDTPPKGCKETINLCDSSDEEDDRKGVCVKKDPVDSELTGDLEGLDLETNFETANAEKELIGVNKDTIKGEQDAEDTAPAAAAIAAAGGGESYEPFIQESGQISMLYVGCIIGKGGDVRLLRWCSLVFSCAAKTALTFLSLSDD